LIFLATAGPSWAKSEIDEIWDSYNRRKRDDQRAEERSIARNQDSFLAREKRPWKVSVAGYGGKNVMGKGYDGFEDFTHGGADVYFRPPKPILNEARFIYHTLFRLSADYFPLKVPAGVYGLEEDVYALTGALVVRFLRFNQPEDRQWVPFVSAGYGGYFDRVTLDTPASGKVSGTHTNLGYNLSAGLFLPCVGPFRLIPEVRLHSIRVPGGASAQNTTYQIGLALWPKERREGGR